MRPGENASDSHRDMRDLGQGSPTSSLALNVKNFGNSLCNRRGGEDNDILVKLSQPSNKKLSFLGCPRGKKIKEEIVKPAEKAT